MRDSEITFKPVDAVRVLTTRKVVRDIDIATLFQAARMAVRQHDVPHRPGQWIALYHRDAIHDVDLEVGVVVPDGYDGPVPLPDGDLMTVRDLPPVRQMACLLHRGSYGDLCWTCQALWRWIEAHGYRVCGPSREVYLNADADDAELLTELQYPLEKI